MPSVQRQTNIRREILSHEMILRTSIITIIQRVIKNTHDIQFRIICLTAKKVS